MRISTNSFYDRGAASMSSLTARADALQTSIATTKKNATPSGDAVAYRQVTVLTRAKTDATQDSANIKLAQSQLAASDSTLGAIETQLQRVHELSVRASTGTLNDTEKATIAQELDAILEDLVKLANSTDGRGGPLFSGSSEAKPYVQAADGSVSYTGTGEAGKIPIGDGAEIQATDSGAKIFSGVPTAAGGTSDIFAIVRDFSTSLRAGTGAGNASTDVTAALKQVGDSRASLGARAARLDLETERMGEAAETRATLLSAVEHTDITAAITELQKTLTVLQATQASFTKLTELSLFNYLR